MTQHPTDDHTARHAEGWRHFMRAATYGAAAVFALLVLLDLFLVR